MAQKRITREQQYALIEENELNHALIYPGDSGNSTGNNLTSKVLPPPGNTRIPKTGNNTKAGTEEVKLRTLKVNVLVENIILLALLVFLLYILAKGFMYLVNQA